MATTTKNYLDLTGLQAYDGLIKTYIGTGDAKAIKTVLWDSTAEQIKFYKKENATLSDTADYSVAISSSDVANLKTRVGLDTQLNSYNTATDLTNIMNVLTGNSETTGSVAKAQADAISTVVGASTDAKTADTVNGAKAYADDAVATAVDGLDVSEFALASVSNNVVNIKGIKEVDGKIAIGDGAGISLEEVAYTGAAADVSIADTGDKLNATTVEGALAELADAIATATDAGKVTCETSSPASGDILRTYSFYQGVLGTDDAAAKAAKKIVDVNIPRDYLVKAAEVKTVTTADDPYTGAEVGDKYIDFTVNTKDSAGTATHLYIPVDDLMSAISAAQNATQVQVAISSSNEISATLVAGGVGTTELASKAVTTAKIDDDAVTGAQIADDAVGAEHIAISAHSESQTHTGGTTDDGLSITVTTTDGQVSAVSGSIAANTYDAYGAAAAAVAALDTSSDVNVATYNSSTTAITITGALSETDGIISGVSTNDIVIAPVAGADITALFPGQSSNQSGE